MSQGITTQHVDYLQRTLFSPTHLEADAAAVIAPPPELRRLRRIVSVGRAQKAYKPEPGKTFHIDTQDVLNGVGADSIPVVFLITGTAEGIGIHMGVWAPSLRSRAAVSLDATQEVLESGLKSLYQTTEFGEPIGIDACDAAGFVIGTPTAKPPDAADPTYPLDRVIRAMNGTWSALVLALPVHHDLVRQLRDHTINELRVVQQRPQASQIANPLAEHYGDLLKLRLKALTLGRSIGMWRTAVYLLGTSTTFARLSSTWRGVFSGDDSLAEPVSVYRSDAVVQRLAAGWAMPNVDPEEFVTRDPAQRPPGSIKHPYPYQTLLTSQQLAAYIHLPQVETSGFAVHRTPAFDVVPPPHADGDTIPIGGIVRGGEVTSKQYEVAQSDMTRHVFVAGVTGAGKTNTIFVLLKEMWQRGVPFLVVEPAKTEYRALIHDRRFQKDLQLFTLGNENVASFRMNAFEVPRGMPVSVHIDLLRSVFNASFGLWNPLPQVLEQCLYRIYADRGWDIASNSNARGGFDAAAFPSLADLVDEVDRYTHTLSYSEEVLGNIRSALLTRLNSLRVGGKGRMLDVRQSVPMTAVLDRPTVMELEPLGDDDDKAFVMGLLFIRLVEHWRTLGSAAHGAVRHVLVIEEAHRLLSNVAQTGRIEDASPRAKAVETFANLLSEVRAYGQGVIVADQVPVKLARDVIKNTNLKIAHRTVDAEDRQVLAGSMAMTDDQSTRLAILLRGQAVVFSEGDDAPLLVAMRNAKDDPNASDRTWPTDDNIRAQMGSFLRTHRDAYLRHPGCGFDDSARLACDAARVVAEDPSFQRDLGRTALAVVDDRDAFDRLWPDLAAIVLRRRSGTVDERQLWTCLCAHAARWFAERRGAQGTWPYSVTRAVADSLETALRTHAEGRDARGAIEQFVERYGAAVAADRRTCEFCAVINGDRPCPYRYSVDDLVGSDALRELWTAAGERDRSPTRENTWLVCQEAADQLVECATTEAGRRAGLCFASHMLAADRHKLRRSIHQIMSELVREAEDG